MANVREELACRTFFPNMPQDMREKYGVDEVLKRIPEGFWRPEDH